MSEEKKLQIEWSQLPVVRKVTSRRAPDTLYHYTRRTGLLGIVAKGEIWASNARYLNDARELSTALETLSQVLRARTPGESSPEAHLLKDIDHFLQDLEPQWDVFVFSLSEDGDQLSQWRAYTRPGDGYSLGFKTEALSQLVDASLFHLAPCYYEDHEHLDLVSTVLEDAVQTISQAPSEASESLKARQQALLRFAAGFFFVAPIIKHRKFSEEKEWRFILPIASVWDPTRVKFRDAGNLLVPYVPIRLPQGELPIDRVVIGPTPHADLEQRALSGLLTIAEAPTARVGTSAIPFRAW